MSKYIKIYVALYTLCIYYANFIALTDSSGVNISGANSLFLVSNLLIS